MSTLSTLFRPVTCLTNCPKLVPSSTHAQDDVQDGSSDVPGPSGFPRPFPEQTISVTRNRSTFDRLSYGPWRSNGLTTYMEYGPMEVERSHSMMDPGRRLPWSETSMMVGPTEFYHMHRMMLAVQAIVQASRCSSFLLLHSYPQATHSQVLIAERCIIRTK